MGQDTDPPPLDEVDELSEYWTENTTISVSRHTKARLDEHRDGRPWDTYLEQLRREHADPITINGVQEMADILVDELAAEAGGPQVDDSDIARAVVRQFDYAELANAVADELEARQR